MRNFSIYALLLVLLLSLDSCTAYKATNTTLFSRNFTKNLPSEPKPMHFKKGDTRVKGIDKAHVIFVFPIGKANIQDAVDKVIEQYPGAVGLTDCSVKSNWWVIPPLYGQVRAFVEGTPIYLDHEQNQLYSNGINTTLQGLTYQQPVTQQQNYQQPVTQQQKNSTLSYHTVKPNETIEDVARNYNVQFIDIITWNKLNSSKLKEGTLLIIYQ